MPHRPSAPAAWSVLSLVLALGGGALSSGCGAGMEAGAQAGAGRGPRGDAPAMAVQVTSLHKARIERFHRTSGTLTAKTQADIVALQAGVIVEITVDEGDKVKEGDVLVRLDGRELSIQAAASKVSVENLQRELGRLEAAEGVIPAEEILKQRYLVDEAKMAAKLSRTQAKQTVVRAPFSGTVITRHVDKGTLATTATPLLTMADLARLELEVHVPERDAVGVEVDSPVHLALVDGTAFEATVVRRAPVVDQATGTVKVTVAATAYPKAAVPGAFVRAEILVGSRPDAPSLPGDAVFELDGTPHVYVIVEGKAHRKPVKVGLRGGGRVEILEGVEADDVVVAEGRGGVTEGMPLRAADAAPDATPPAPAGS